MNLKPHTVPGVWQLRGRVSKKELMFTADGDRFPGARWSDEVKAWLVSEDRWDVDPKPPGTRVYADIPPPSDSDFLSDTLPHQRQAVRRLLFEGTLYCAWDTGVGKTRVGIEAHRMLRTKTLVLCPPNVVSVWEKRLPAVANLQPFNIARKPTKKNPGPTADECLIHLCPITQMHKLPYGEQYGLIIVDECHRLMHSGTKQAAEVEEFIHTQSNAKRLFLSATPMSTDLHNLHNQLHIMAPDRFGTFSQWVHYYHAVDYEGYKRPGAERGARRIHGVKLDKAAEWTARLDKVIDRKTTVDVLTHMPAIRFSKRRLPVLGNRRGGGIASINSWKSTQKALITDRIRGVCDLFSTPADVPTCFVTFFVDTAYGLGSKLACPVVSGSLPLAKRQSALRDAKGLDIVVSMKSIQEGIDLRDWPNVVIVEPYPVPSVMLQTLGRFRRLGGVDEVHVTFCNLPGSSDGMVIDKLVRRMEEMEALGRSGNHVSDMKAVLEEPLRDKDFLKQLEMVSDEDGWDWDD